MKITNINTKCQHCKDFMDRLLKEQVESLKEEKKVLEKALELMACSYFGNLSCIYFPNTDTQIETNVALFDYFKNLAKEVLKSERI